MALSRHLSFVSLRVSPALVALGMISCSNSQPSHLKSAMFQAKNTFETLALPLQVAPDTELFKNNDVSIDPKTSRPMVSPVLQKEIKQQFLMSLALSNGFYKEVLAASELTLIELNITRIEHTNSQLNLQGQMGRSSTPTDAGGQTADAKLEVENSKYNVAFVFFDESLKQVYRFQLESPLDVQERIKVTAEAALAIEPVANLKPKWLASALAAFFKDINISLKAGGSWEKLSEITTSLYYRGQSPLGSSELMNTLGAGVLTKLCIVAQSARNLDSSACSFNLPSISDPLADLKASWAKFKVLKVAKCQSLPSQGFMFDALLSAPSDGLAQQLDADDPIFVYLKTGRVWKRAGQAQVIGTNTESDCSKTSPGLECVRVQFSKPMWNNTCEDIYENGYVYGFSKLDQETIIE
jgi:hypothetical protein